MAIADHLSSIKESSQMGISKWENGCYLKNVKLGESLDDCHFTIQLRIFRNEALLWTIDDQLVCQLRIDLVQSNQDAENGVVQAWIPVEG